MDFVDLVVMDRIRRHQTPAGMVMRLVIPGGELPVDLLDIFDTAETFQEPWLILQGFKVAFGEGGVVRDMRPAVRFDHAQIGERESGSLCFYWPAAIDASGIPSRSESFLGLDDRLGPL